MISIEHDRRVALVRLHSENTLNPLTDELIQQLVEALLFIEQDSEIHVTVLTGYQRAFAAGADIAAMNKLDYVTAFTRDYIGRGWSPIGSLRKPLIAAISGYALGGGCELTMMCDIAIASEDAVFGQPEVRLGIVPGAGGTQRLPRVAGKSSAMLMCLTGESISAAEALRLGLISAVTTKEDLLTEALKLAHTISGYSLPVVMAIKEAVNRAFETSLSEGLLFERRLFHAGFSLFDQKEGMTAFLERRKPEFRNG